MRQSAARRCPACQAAEVVLRPHAKDPADFGVEAVVGFALFRCEACQTEFAEPRQPMIYSGISDKYKTYEGFLQAGEFAGRIHHTKRGTSDWKDSPMVYQILRQITPEGTFLDFAAGSGYMSELGRELGFTPLAVERSVEFQAFLRENVPGIAVYSELKEVSEAGTKATVALAMHVIEHVEDPVATLAELRAVVKPEGLLIVVVPNVERSYYRFEEDGTEMEDQIARDGIAIDFPPHHLTRFTGSGLKLALGRAGFRGAVTGYSLVSLWDLFHDGLGDETFRFASYFEDGKRMPTIARVEKNLNEVLARLGLENLGNAVIALASEGKPVEELADLLEASRRRTIEVYQQSVEEEFGRLQKTRASIRGENPPDVGAEEQDPARAMEEKDAYVESLLAALERKDGELRAQEEGLRSAHEALRQIGETLAEKDAYIDSLLQVLVQKNSHLGTQQAALDANEKRLAETEQRRAETEQRRAETEQRRAETEQRRAETEQRLAEAQWHLDLIPFRKALIWIGRTLKVRKGGR